MKEYMLAALFSFCLFFSACGPESPEKYFDLAVLNSNFLMGFANDGQLRELQSPSVKMSERTGEAMPMKRIEVIITKIQFVEANFAKLMNLEATEDTKDILRVSLALHELVLAAYKNEYTQLARSYDDNAAKEELEKQAQVIHDKYYSRYEDLYNELITLGKSYAAKHNIEVNWGM
jgi:hypothetical protein